MVEGICKKCGKFRRLNGGWCEVCSSEAEAKKSLLNDERERFSKDELKVLMNERRHDKKFWSP